MYFFLLKSSFPHICSSIENMFSNFNFFWWKATNVSNIKTRFLVLRATKFELSEIFLFLVPKALLVALIDCSLTDTGILLRVLLLLGLLFCFLLDVLVFKAEFFHFLALTLTHSGWIGSRVPVKTLRFPSSHNLVGMLVSPLIILGLELVSDHLFGF